LETMGRSARQLPNGCSFHITLRCNSRAFLIARWVRRDLLLAVLRKAQEKLGFRLHGSASWPTTCICCCNQRR
jgi:REP element-mobilizing transposase RayT